MNIPTILTMTGLLFLAACGSPDPAQPVADEVEPPSDTPQSIIRDDVRAETGIEADIEVPLDLTVTIGDADELDAQTIRAIDAFMGEERLSNDDPVTLFGHSDSVGSDEANERASRKRAQLVADYLEEKGVDPERITIVALGEHNPIAPNKMLDGGDDEDGQRRNRRVEIAIGTPAEVANRRAAEGDETIADERGASDAAPAASRATQEPASVN